MKRMLALVLAALMLTGCALSGNKMKEPVTFYYLRNQSENIYDEFYAEGIIGAEVREASGHRNDLSYLLTVYFSGPLDPGLVSPFPMGFRMIEITPEDHALTLLLNPVLIEKSDLEITLACACIAKTCMDLADVDTVCIESRTVKDKILFSRTFTKDNLFLNDNDIQSLENTESIQ